MQFERGVFAESLILLMNCGTTVLGVVVGEYLIQTLQEAVSSSFVLDFGRVVLWSWLAYMAHAELLLEPGHEQDTDITRIFGFALRFFSLFLLGLIPCLVLLNAAGRLDFANLDPETAIGGLMIVLVPVFAGISVLVFSFLGTILPSYVAGHETSSTRILLRGGRQFLWISWRLLIGPILLFACAAVVILIPIALFGSSGNLLSGPGPDVVMTVFSLAAYLIIAWGVLMMTVILSRAYLRDEALGEPAYA
jgi:hypothetical protein